MVSPRLQSSPRAAVSFLACGLLSLFAVLCYRAASDASVAFDEPGHMLAGYSYWTHDGPEVATANFRAAQLWLALPLMPLRPHFPEAIKHLPGLAIGVEAEQGRRFLHDPRNDTAAMLRASRTAVTVLGIILGAVLFVWSRRLHGDVAGLLTLGLYCFEPTVIAHSSLATTDVAITLGFTLALAAWWSLLHRVTSGTIIACGLATGVLASTKISAGLLVPTVLVMLLVRLASRRDLWVRWPWESSTRLAANPLRPLLVATAVVLTISYGVIWDIYGFRYAEGRLLNDFAWRGLVGPEATWVQRSLNFLRLHHLLPEAYLYDLKWFFGSAAGRRAYLLGHYSVEGWWSYFPVAWLAKTSLSMIAALALAAGAAGLTLVRRGQPRRIDGYNLAPLIAFVVIYGACAVAGPMNLGLRHLLPIYPGLLILAGVGVHLLATSARRARAVLVAGLTVGSAVAAWSASPYFLSYFNPAAGGTSNGHRLLVESNYDWGQDLPKIARWLEQRATQPAAASVPVFFSYYGLGDIARYGIQAQLLPQEPDYRPTTVYDLTPGTYVISATILQALGGRAVWGPWRPSLERVYRALETELAPLYAPVRADHRDAGPSSLPEGLRQKIDLYDELRFARLCAFLRQRPPSVRITPGIFVYAIAAEDLAAALQGPPPPPPGEPAIKGLSKLSVDQINFIR